uniref:Putative secreted protein n=1 Tax=Panstrongylus lignarius TaxID=156445 RepID=A0A224Y5D0_9HEMI
MLEVVLLLMISDPLLFASMVNSTGDFIEVFSEGGGEGTVRFKYPPPASICLSTSQLRPVNPSGQRHL